MNTNFGIAMGGKAYRGDFLTVGLVVLAAVLVAIHLQKRHECRAAF